MYPCGLTLSVGGGNHTMEKPMRLMSSALARMPL